MPPWSVEVDNRDSYCFEFFGINNLLVFPIIQVGICHKIQIRFVDTQVVPPASATWRQWSEIPQIQSDTLTRSTPLRASHPQRAQTPPLSTFPDCSVFRLAYLDTSTGHQTRKWCLTYSPELRDPIGSASRTAEHRKRPPRKANCRLQTVRSRLDSIEPAKAARPQMCVSYDRIAEPYCPDYR